MYRTVHTSVDKELSFSIPCHCSLLCFPYLKVIHILRSKKITIIFISDS